MPATFVDIAAVLAKKGFQTPVLNVLVRDVLRYDAMTIQTGGDIHASASGVKHVNRAEAIAKFGNFLLLAADRNVDLAMTPEYSCPWDALANVLEAEVLPDSGKLWAICCESILPAELEQFKAQHPNVEWIHEPLPQGAGNFLDCLVYLTPTARIADNAARHVAVIQFKSHPMGGDSFEQANLKLGSQMYFWRNPEDRIRLITLICSESLFFQQAQQHSCKCDLHPYLILHPQLDPAPRHVAGSAYRGLLLGQQDIVNLEIITLNWARGFKFVTFPKIPPSECGGSSIYTKAKEFDTSDARFEFNHQKGLYYANWHAHRTKLSVFNYNEHVFHFRNHKVRQEGAAPEARRMGPEMVELWSWDQGSAKWQAGATGDDGFSDLCSGYPQAGCNYHHAPPASALDRERLLTLTAGRLKPAKDWFLPDMLDSLYAETDERTKRLTFTHENAQSSRDYRHNYLEQFVRLQLAVLPNGAQFPLTILDLAGNWQIRPPGPADGFRSNLVSQNGQAKEATVIYVGLRPREYALKLLNDLARAWGVDLTRRLVVWFDSGQQIQNVHFQLFNITSGNEPPASITS